MDTEKVCVACAYSYQDSKDLGFPKNCYMLRKTM